MQADEDRASIGVRWIRSPSEVVERLASDPWTANALLVTKQSSPWVNAALRTLVWLGASAWWAYLKKPRGASALAARPGAVAWSGIAFLVAGWVLHLWSNVSLARSEARPFAAPTGLVAHGPYRYVRNPIYLAGGLVFLGIYLFYSQWSRADIAAALAMPLAFHLLVVRFEEPALIRRLGSAYDEYCRRVPRWIPRSVRRDTAGKAAPQ
jgi:protein-S-isoprenylcysteine O-methyltransferase Ste14